ncbi:MAG: hypothetical protein AAF960_20505 [Bacteroidota bacterium]
MKKIGCVTCREFSDLYYDDQYLLPLFEKHQLKLVPIVWDEPFDYESLDMLLFRSAWDYHQKTEAFVQYLQQLKKLKVPVFNPITLIEKNYDKHYLRDLANFGFSVIPTLFFSSVETVNLEQMLLENNWQKGVIKPVISMSAYHTYAFDNENCATLQKKLAGAYGQSAVMVQKFADEITTDGEWSLVFFDKKYCMTAHKQPKKGDFRVQTDLGGTVTYQHPPDLIVEEARAILDSFSEPILYARMDGIIHKGHFQLMEAELIDPELYFRSGAKVQQGFLEAIQAYLD